MTTFVGREAEIASVAELVRSSSVVTLTGVGGVGKTRLALQVAAEVVPHFRDGAWFAELAGVRDPDAVPDALFAVFGLQPRGGVSATGALLEFLAAKDLLLCWTTASTCCGPRQVSSIKWLGSVPGCGSWRRAARASTSQVSGCSESRP